jgi:hypothetical protein
MHTSTPMAGQHQENNEIRKRFGFVYLSLIFVFSFSSRYTLGIAAFNVRPEYVLVGIGLVFLVLSGHLPLFPPKGRNFLFGWLTVGLFSSLVAPPSISEGLKNFLLILAGALTLTLVAYVGQRSRKDVLSIYLNIWFAAILIGVLGTVFDVFAGTQLFSQSYFDLIDLRRTFGTFWEPNFYGISSMMLGIILLDERLHNSPIKPKPLWWLLTCILGVIMGATRSAQIAFAVGVLVLWLFRSRLTRRNLYLLAVGVLISAFWGALIISGIFIPQTVQRFFVTFANLEGSSSIVGRLSVDEVALRQVPDYLWFGHGADAFGQFNSESSLGGLFAYLGDFFTELLYDTGIVGTALACCWLMLHHLAAFRLSGGRNAPPHLWSFAFSSVLMFVTFGATSGVFISFPWVHMGMTAMLLSDARKQIKTT